MAVTVVMMAPDSRPNFRTMFFMNVSSSSASTVPGGGSAARHPFG
jgi:hypothetical protein